MVPERDVLAPILVLAWAAHCTQLYTVTFQHSAFFPLPLTSGWWWPLTTGRCEAGPGPGSGQGCKLVTGGQQPRHGRHGARPEPRERSWRKFRNIARHRILGTGYRVYPLQNDCRVCKIPNVPDTRQCTAGDLWRLQQHWAGCCSEAGICGVCMLSWSQDTCPFVSVRGNFTRL